MTKHEEDREECVATGTPDWDITKDRFGRQDILLEKGLLCVIGNAADNELERHAVVHLPQNKVFWDLCGHDVRCPQCSAGASEMGRLDNHGITALCGSFGED